jgi:DNA-binding transcriptional LysR family regulator
VIDQELGEHPYLLIAPPGHPLAGPGPGGCDISSEALLDETFLMREPGSGTRILTERLLDRIGEGRPYRSIELGSNETIKQAVIAGLGIAVISAHTVVAELETGRLDTIRAEGLPVLRRWFLIHRADTELTPAGEALRQFIGDLGPAFLPTIPARRLDR